MVYFLNKKALIERGYGIKLFYKNIYLKSGQNKRSVEYHFYKSLYNESWICLNNLALTISIKYLVAITTSYQRP